MCLGTAFAITFGEKAFFLANILSCPDRAGCRVNRQKRANHEKWGGAAQVACNLSHPTPLEITQP